MSDAGQSRSARLAWTAVVVILLGSVGLVTYALVHPSSPAAAFQPAVTSPAVLTTLSTIPLATFDGVGVTVPGVDLIPPQVVAGRPAPTVGGKAEVIVVGAEFCPFCAAERWPVVVALSRFGRFTVLHDASSATQSVFPGTATFSFRNARYTSALVAFTGIELYSDQIGPDGSFTRTTALSASQAAAVGRNGAGRGVSASTIPFVDVGGMVATTSAFSPALLTGQSQAQIASLAAQLPPRLDPSAAASGVPPTGQAIIAAANQLTAGICMSTGQRPTAVCRSKGVRAADVSLGIPVPAP